MTAMQKLTRLGLIAIVLLGCVGCDQVSKQLVRSHIDLGASQSFLGDTLRLTHAQNPGAFLGAGASLPPLARAAILQGVVGLLVLGLLCGAAFMRKLDAWRAVALTLLAASGLGNLIDRLAHDGLVTDFLNMGIGPLRTGIFNIADVVGVIGIAIFVLRPADQTP
jgi:signal peptidase II